MKIHVDEKVLWKYVLHCLNNTTKQVLKFLNNYLRKKILTKSTYTILQSINLQIDSYCNCLSNLVWLLAPQPPYPLTLTPRIRHKHTNHHPNFVQIWNYVFLTHGHFSDTPITHPLALGRNGLYLSHDLSKQFVRLSSLLHLLQQPHPCGKYRNYIAYTKIK